MPSRKSSKSGGTEIAAIALKRVSRQLFKLPPVKLKPSKKIYKRKKKVVE